MPTEYVSLVEALKSLKQAEDSKAETPVYHYLPMAEDGWNTRPDTVSYGMVQLDFEANADRGNDYKESTSYEGSVDLFSMNRSGAGWVELICSTLDQYCEGSWSLNSHQYERDLGLFHWEWVFQVFG